MKKSEIWGLAFVGLHSSSTGAASAGKLGTKPGSCDGLLRLFISNLYGGSGEDGETGAIAGESKGGASTGEFGEAGSTTGASVEGCLFDGAFFVSYGGSFSEEPKSEPEFEPESEPELEPWNVSTVP